MSKAMRINIMILILLALLQGCDAADIDFLSGLNDSPEKRKSLGLEKLNGDERASLNELLNRAYELGLKNSPKDVQHDKEKLEIGVVPVAVKQPVYLTKISEDKDDILILENGAIVKVLIGYVGYVGYRKNAVLYKDGSGYKIWIEGKRSFKCEILKDPEIGNGTPISGALIEVSEVKADGKIIIALDGSIYEVDDIYSIETALWLGPFEALLIDGARLLNVESGDEIVDVIKIR